MGPKRLDTPSLSRVLEPLMPSLWLNEPATCFPSPSHLCCWRPTLPGGLGGAVVSGPICSAAAFPGSGSGCLPKRNGTGTSAPSQGFTRSGPAAVGGGGGRCGEALDSPGDTSRAITPLLRVNSSLMCTKILPIPNVSSVLALVLIAPPSTSVPVSTCPSWPLRLYNSSSSRVLVSTPQTPPWNSVGRGRRVGDPDRSRLAVGRGTRDSTDGRRNTAGPSAPAPYLPPPTRDLAQQREGTVSRRGVSGLRQKCGL